MLDPRMISKANLAVVAALGFAAATIYLVHHSQSADRKVSKSSKALTRATCTTSSHAHISHTHQHTPTQRMRMGVERDVERQRRKEENVRLLEEQITLRHKLEGRDSTKR